MDNLSDEISSTMVYKEKLRPCAVHSKHLLLGFSAFFLILGLCMIAVGKYLTVYTFYNYGQHITWEYFFDTRFFSLVNTLYTIGTIMAAVSVLGCVGAFKESIFVLLLFSICLVTVFALEITFAATGYIVRDQIKESMTKGMQIMMQDYGTNGASRRTVDNIQLALGCCGINHCQEWKRDLPEYNSFTSKLYGYQDPQQYIAFDECRINTTDHVFKVRLPKSCCSKFDNYHKCLAISEHGCIFKFGLFLQTYFIGIAALIAVIQITGMVLACLLAKSLYIQKIKRGMKYSLLQE